MGDRDVSTKPATVDYSSAGGYPVEQMTNELGGTQAWI